MHFILCFMSAMAFPLGITFKWHQIAAHIIHPEPTFSINAGSSVYFDGGGGYMCRAYNFYAADQISCPIMDLQVFLNYNHNCPLTSINHVQIMCPVWR